MSERETQARKEANADSRSMENRFSRMVPVERCEFCNKANVIISYKLDLQAANSLRRLLMRKPPVSKTELLSFHASSFGTCQSCLKGARFSLHLHTYVRNWDPEQLLVDVNEYIFGFS